MRFIQMDDMKTLLITLSIISSIILIPTSRQTITRQKTSDQYDQYINISDQYINQINISIQ